MTIEQFRGVTARLGEAQVEFASAGQSIQQELTEEQESCFDGIAIDKLEDLYVSQPVEERVDNPMQEPSTSRYGPQSATIVDGVVKLASEEVVVSATRLEYARYVYLCCHLMESRRTRLTE